MKITRPALAVFAAAAALALAGCASSSGGSASGDKTCAVLASEVRDINNGAQNTLAGTIDSADAQKKAEEYLSGLTDRIGTLETTWKDDDAVSSALKTFGDRVSAAYDVVAAAPTDGSGVDADAAATATTDIQDSATKVTVVCKD